MTRKDRKRYSREFKLEAVRQVESSGKPVTEVARELDISVHQLYRWRDDLTKRGAEAFPGHGKRTGLEEEVARLRRENARLRDERDILKKAAVYFAKGLPPDTDS